MAEMKDFKFLSKTFFFQKPRMIKDQFFDKILLQMTWCYKILRNQQRKNAADSVCWNLEILE